MAPGLTGPAQRWAADPDSGAGLGAAPRRGRAARRRLRGAVVDHRRPAPAERRRAPAHAHAVVASAAVPRFAVVGHVEWIEFGRVVHVPAPGEIVEAGDAFEEAAGSGAVAAVQLAKLAGG